MRRRRSGGFDRSLETFVAPFLYYGVPPKRGVPRRKQFDYQ